MRLLALSGSLDEVLDSAEPKTYSVHMETTSTTTYRAVFRHANNSGSSYCVERNTAMEAWADVDAALARGHEWDGRWAVLVTITTTTTQDIVR